ncbi:MAG: UvrD-helicase domain-containing protein, partial [Myxococcota bacterium]
MSAESIPLAPPAAFEPEAIPLAGRTTFIEASAGTGKTHALATLYLRLLTEHDLRPADILVVTFTQAATAELRDRIRGRIREALAGDPGPGEASLRRALQRFDEAAIFTIHGFCQRTLQESAFESGLAFEAELATKPEILQRTLAHDLWMRLLEGEDDALREWLTAGAGRRRWSFEPDALFALIREHLGADETMPVWPALEQAEAAGADDDPGRIAAAVDAAWLRIAELWTARRETIIPLWLDDATGFNRTQYKAETIRKRWIPDLDALARDVFAATTAAGRIGLERPACFEKLTNEGMAGGMKKNVPPPSDPFFDACSALARLLPALDASFDARALALRRRFVEAVREADRRRRGEEHVLFFDDLLSQLRSALAAPGGELLGAALRARYRFALIDEFQDTDAVQYEIFSRVWNDEATRAAGGGLVLIGDPKQAIYSFRGADIHTYLAARADAGGGIHTLGVNHRSEPAVVAAVNAVFGAASDPFAEPAIAFHPVAAADRERPQWTADERYRAGLRVSLLASEDAEQAAPGEAEAKGSIALRFARTGWMQAVARDVAELLESGAMIGDRALAPSDIAILARRRSELDAVRRALDAVGIPSVSRGDGNVFESREAWELSSVLAAWLHPGDFRRLRAALSSGAHGYGAAELAALDDESAELAGIAERFAEYGRLWAQAGLPRAFESWRAREGVSERLLAHPDGDRRLTNWLHLAELLARVASERGASRAGLVAWLDRAIADEASRQGLESEATLLRLERDDEAVQLVTLHASKGLEYEVVYLPCLWETFESREASGKSASETGKRSPVRFADPEANGRRSLDLGVPGEAYAAHLALEKAQMRAEQQRLLYVGLTRAKRHCVVFWGRAGSAYARSPLARLVFADAIRAAGDDPKAIDEAIKAKSDADWRAAWQAIADAAPPGSICIEEADLRPRGPWRSPAAGDEAFDFEPVQPLALRALATTSFSALVRGAHRRSAVVAGPLATGRDLDAGVDDRPREADEPSDLDGDMHAFPRGAEAGTLLHEVLERCDFAAFDESAAARLAEEWLGQSGLDRALVPSVVHVVRSVARTPLTSSPRPLRLADIAPGQLRAELEFTLAAPGEARGRGVSATPGEARGRGFSAAALAEILADAPAGSPLARYADRVGTLAWPQLAGHLRGFIDAVFCDGERYFVVDYKSNHLGARQADYLPERLVQPMIESDYVLQYLLYTVAVDRHLASRIVGYDYERHFGGAFYLFLRGLSEGHA